MRGRDRVTLHPLFPRLCVRSSPRRLESSQGSISTLDRASPANMLGFHWASADTCFGRYSRSRRRACGKNGLGLLAAPSLVRTSVPGSAVVQFNHSTCQPMTSSPFTAATSSKSICLNPYWKAVASNGSKPRAEATRRASIAFCGPQWRAKDRAGHDPRRRKPPDHVAD